MNFIQVAKIDQIPLGAMASFTVGGKELLIANYDGNYYAMNLKCTHMGGDLSKGKLEGKVVTCPRHGSKFDVTTGECITGPKFGFIKPKIKDGLHYAVEIDGNRILVDL